MGILFTLSIFWVVYVYAGFPLLAWVRAKYAPAKPIVVSREYAPTVSVIICAYNEAESITGTLDGIQNQSYCSTKMEVVVASDGSLDATNELVAVHPADNVRLLALPRQGKVAAMNAAVAAATGEIIVFTDANSVLECTAVARLVATLSDPAVGGVAGDQVYVRQSASLQNQGEESYWNLERALKRWQSLAGNVTSSTGALHAIRRDIFEPLPSGVTDDFAISTLVILKKHRLVFEPEALAFEPPSESKSDFARKRRIMTRGLRGVYHRRSLLNPFQYGRYSHQLLVQKVLRRLTFLPLFGVFVASVALAPNSLFFLMLSAVQFIWWGSCIWLSRSTRTLPKPLQLMGYFWSVNRAAVSAAVDVLRGNVVDRWEPRAG